MHKVSIISGYVNIVIITASLHFNPVDADFRSRKSLILYLAFSLNTYIALLCYFHLNLVQRSQTHFVLKIVLS